MNSLIALLFLVAAVTSTGCAMENIDRTDLVGRYVANYENAIDTLELREDGTYVHHYKSLTGDKEFTNTNTWEFEYKDEKPRIIFSEFISGLPEQYSGPSKNSGYWITEIRRSLISSSVKLPIFEDLDYYYTKEKL